MITAVLALLFFAPFSARVWAQAPPNTENTENQEGMKRYDLSGSTGIPKIFWKSVEYGVGAGVLVGIVSASDFQKNFTKHLDPQNIFRGMSYGLYGGILLGIYLSYMIPDRADDGGGGDGTGGAPAGSDQNQQGGLNGELKYRARLEVAPFISELGAAGIQLKWSI